MHGENALQPGENQRPSGGLPRPPLNPIPRFRGMLKAIARYLRGRNVIGFEMGGSPVFSARVNWYLDEKVGKRATSSNSRCRRIRLQRHEQ